MLVQFYTTTYYDTSSSTLEFFFDSFIREDIFNVLH